MQLYCKRSTCLHAWEYRGKKGFKQYPEYACCPRCKTSVKIGEKK